MVVASQEHGTADAAAGTVAPASLGGLLVPISDGMDGIWWLGWADAPKPPAAASVKSRFSQSDAATESAMRATRAQTVLG